MQFIDRAALGGVTSVSIRDSASARRDTSVGAFHADGEAVHFDPAKGAVPGPGNGADAAPAFLNLKTPVLQSLFGSAVPVPTNWPADPLPQEESSDEGHPTCGWQWPEPKN